MNSPETWICAVLSHPAASSFHCTTTQPLFWTAVHPFLKAVLPFLNVDALWVDVDDLVELLAAGVDSVGQALYYHLMLFGSQIHLVSPKQFKIIMAPAG